MTMKKITLTVCALVMLPMFAVAQNWTPNGVFPADSSMGPSHGITVDGEGKIWTMDYYATGSLRTDSTVSVVDIRVFNPDGSEVGFSPVQGIEVDGETVIFNSSNGRGIATDGNGDILYAHSSILYRINHKTGEGMNRVEPGIGSLSKPAADGDGNIYVTGVLGGRALLKYNADMDTTSSNGEVVIASVPEIARTLAVSEDGNTIYAPRFTGGYMLVYKRANPLVPFADADTVLRNSDIESMAIDPYSGNVWVSAANYFRPDSVRFTQYSPNVWYEYDPETWEKLDSVAWTFSEDGDLLKEFQLPRAIAFSNDANTLYIGAFRQDGDSFLGIQSFSRANPVSNEREDQFDSPDGYKLSQNYPNPFNPTTNIQFEIREAGDVSLKVYDLTGREVASLVNSRMSAGEHSVTFDASNLSSGVYLYVLQANNIRLTNKMTLIK